MIAHLEPATDQFRYATSGPKIRGEAVRCRLVGQPKQNLPFLIRRQKSRAARCGLGSHSSITMSPVACHPLGNRYPMHPEKICHSDLRPARKNLLNSDPSPRFQLGSSSFASHARSNTTTLKACIALLTCEAVGDRIAPPATVGLTELVTQAAVRDRSAAQLKAKPIGKIFAELGETGRKLLLPSAEHVSRFVRTTGSLFPLTWLCLRLEESQGASGWEAELQSKTGLASDHELTPAELAAQVFTERQAQRLFRSLVRATG
jgi:hypothetical protein